MKIGLLMQMRHGLALRLGAKIALNTLYNLNPKNQ
jgi:hypothetical protein